MPLLISLIKGVGNRIIKVNHAGEFGAINIYRAQIAVANVTSPGIVPTLKDFLEHEKKHLEIFREVLSRRGCRVAVATGYAVLAVVCWAL